jgi:nitrile hydratase accessory protein
MTPEAPFAEPWQAELFALTVALSDAGHFTWGTWTEAFGATLKRHGAARPLDGGADYYAAWLETLEGLLDGAGLAPKPLAADMRRRWEAAYLSTPHGHPVRLAD